jgi:enoyl-CoA hydratase/carnithine racemase
LIFVALNDIFPQNDHGNGSVKMSENKVELKIDGFKAFITLNRPEKLNALNRVMLEQLNTILAELESNQQVRVVLLTAAGDKAFCVGADINAWAGLEPLQMSRTWIRMGHRIFSRLTSLPQPVIAVLNGYTFGGGLELALAADLRIASDNVELALPEVSIGTIPGWTGSQKLPALVGLARAKEMMLTGRRITALRAEQWGLVNEVHNRDKLYDAALSLADEIVNNAPVSVQLAKQLANAAGGLDAGLALESLASALSGTTEDNKEGIASFRERRPPNFKGS